VPAPRPQGLRGFWITEFLEYGVSRFRDFGRSLSPFRKNGHYRRWNLQVTIGRAGAQSDWFRR
jgi:hypothetical protein